MDFTLRKYDQLCMAVVHAGYRSVTIAEWLESQARDNSLVAILRHDVDRRPRNALSIARLEASHGIRATYYFRATRGSFRPDLMRQIHSLGHEVGYHYETLATTKGDIGRALELFRRELETFRSVVPVITACMHGSPLSPWNNLDIWDAASPADFGLLGEPYLMDYSRLAYYTDTGRSWAGETTNLRDRVSCRGEIPKVRATDDLIRLVWQRRFSLAIQAHPERWNATLPQMAISWTQDAVANAAKRIVRRVRAARRPQARPGP